MRLRLPLVSEYVGLRGLLYQYVLLVSEYVGLRGLLYQYVLLVSEVGFEGNYKHILLRYLCRIHLNALPK